MLDAAPDVYFSRTAGLNAPLYQVDLHIGCLRVILARGGGVVGAGAACLGLWRRMSCFGLALDVGLPALLVRPTEHRAVSSLSHQVIEHVVVGMVPIGCLCGSTLLWVAKSSLDGYLLALVTFLCRLGSRNVGEILVLSRG